MGQQNKIIQHKHYAYIIATIVVMVSIFFFTKVVYSSANDGNSVSIYEIDYEKETLTIQANQKDSVIFISDSTQKTWDALVGEFDSNHRITMDISWVSKTANYVLSIKGDASTTPIKVTLPKQNSNFKVYLDVSNSTLNYSNIGTATTVYWRKSVSTKWNAFNIYEEDDIKKFQDEMERFSIQGISLVFRIGQIKGNAISVGQRPSKEVTIHVAKRANAPSVTLNKDTLSIAVKTTMEYKRSDSETWNSITSSTLLLEDIAEEALYSSSNTSPKKVDLDFRIKGTDTKVASKTTTLTIPVQSTIDTSDDNISFEYTGSKQCRFHIEKATTTVPYEYTVVQPEKTLTLTTAVFKSVTTSDYVTLTSTAAPKGSKIYIRKKSTTDELASSFYIIEVGEYAMASSLLEGTALEKVAGSEQTLTFAVKVPRADTKISSVTFGGKAVTIKSNSAVKLTDASMYTITVTITSTSEVEAESANFDKALKGVITLNNGDTIEDGVTLKIIKSATVKTASYTKYKDLDFEDAIEITVALNHDDKKNVTVSKVTLDKQELKFSQSGMDENNEITVTVDSSFLEDYEENIASAKMKTAIPFVITLSNGEKISSGATMTVKLAATVVSDTSGLGLSYSAYIDSITPTVTPSVDEDNKKETTEKEQEKEFKNPELTVTIDKSLFEEDDSITIGSVIWQNQNILRSFSCNQNTIKLVLDIDKIANAVTIKSGKTYSGAVMIQLKTDSKEDYVVVNSGYRITLVE